MNLAVVQRILGLLLMLFSVTMLPPLGVALYFQDGNWQPFADAFIALLAIGAVTWWPVRRKVRELRVRDGFLVVALFWAVLGVAGAAPLLLSSEVQMTVTDAVFESISGFTTTGATVLIGLDALPESLLYYRMQIEWLGGIGMVVLAVALLPMLGVGGMQLLRAETPGPVKDSKLTPRITETAKVLWIVYVTITAACALAYWAAGMSPFDALAHSFSTVSTGGNSTHDANIGYFDNEVIEAIAVVFMFLGGVNFSLHFLAWRQRRIRDYLRDPEFRAYCLIVRRSGACPASFSVSCRLHADEFGLLHRRLLALAWRLAGDSDVVDVHRRLRGLDFRRHEGRTLAVDLEAGTARGGAARAPERGGAGQTRLQTHRSARNRCGMGILCAVHPVLQRVDGAADRHWRGSDHCVFRHRRLHEQHGHRTRRGSGQFPHADGTRPLDLRGCNAARSSRSLSAARAAVADVLAAVTPANRSTGKLAHWPESTTEPDRFAVLPINQCAGWPCKSRATIHHDFAGADRYDASLRYCVAAADCRWLC
jgi:hypothetical protein